MSEVEQLAEAMPGLDEAVLETAKPEEADAPEAQKEPEAPFPKKAVNAITRRDRQIGKLRAELQQLRAQMTQQPQAPQKEADLNPDDFENYGDFLQAKIDRMVEEKLKAGQQVQQEQQAKTGNDAQRAAWVEQRETEIAGLAKKAAETITDFQEVALENMDIVSEFPEGVEQAFLEAENPPLAFYTLAKEGKLESLIGMTPTQAAAEIARATIRGEQLANPKPTKAPQPISANRGTGASQTSLNRMTPEQIEKWVHG